MPGDAMTKAAGDIAKAAEEIADPEVAVKVAELKEKQRGEREHELTEVEILKIENANLKIAALGTRMKSLEAQLAAVQEEIRERLGFPKGTVLSLNQERMTVRQKPKE